MGRHGSYSRTFSAEEGMNGFDIVMLIAVILFARLGIRLVMKYLKMKKEAKEAADDKETANEQDR